MFQAPVVEIFRARAKFSRSPKSLLKLPGGLQSIRSAPHLCTCTCTWHSGFWLAYARKLAAPVFWRLFLSCFWAQHRYVSRRSRDIAVWLSSGPNVFSRWVPIARRARRPLAWYHGVMRRWPLLYFHNVSAD